MVDYKYLGLAISAGLFFVYCLYYFIKIDPFIESYAYSLGMLLSCAIIIVSLYKLNKENNDHTIQT